PERIAGSVAKLLKKLDIEMLTSSRVAEVRADGVLLADGKGFVPAEHVVWAAGVRGPDILGNLAGLEATKSNQLVVEPTLQTTRDPAIFAIGDCAYAVLSPGARPVPPRAQASHQQARHMVGQIERRLAGKPLKPFVYRDFGSLVSLGDYNAVANLMGFVAGKGLRIEGFFARLMYRSLYAMHQKALHGYTKVVLDTLARALTRRTEPRVKLH
ncbi:MAG TPA: FAD-dependent oxidoreductase, partial [Propylenella sp.]|nr:FAD-dependent oxidoreductase [Propylenella sp.]